MNQGKIQKFYFFILILVFVFGCATSSQREEKVSSFPGMAAREKKAPFQELAEHYRLKAWENEKNKDFGKSLRSWEVVADLLPADPEARGKVTLLKKQLSEVAEQHFRKGVVHYQNSSHSLARKEFLRALYFNPNHTEALDYLKSKLPGEDTLLHPVKKGETLRSIAQEIYRDAQKDFLIAYFNGLESDAKIEPPAILRLPLYDSPAAIKGADARKVPSDTIPEAEGRSQQAPSASIVSPSLAHAASTGKVPEPKPMSPESTDASYYESGKQLSREKNFQEALEAFYRVDPGYKDVKSQIAENKKQIAESHYINGIKYFTEEEIENAIEEWETALALDPNHPKARKDIEAARLLLRKLEKIK